MMASCCYVTVSALKENGYSRNAAGPFFFTIHSYQRVEKIQSALLQICSAFSQNAAC
jgi:hypothetical protein